MPELTTADLLAQLGDEPPESEPQIDPREHFTRDTLDAGELLTLAEAAERIGKPEGTLRRWMSEGRLHAPAKLGRRLLVGWGDVVEVEYRIRTDEHGRRRPRPRGGMPRL